MEINENEVYTTAEMQEILKISQSTAMRMLKTGLIRAAKVGKQYRIMGKELLRLVSPQLEDKVGKIYNKGRKWVHEGIDESPKPVAKHVKQS
ncbi:MAG: helix-turn-helix domain-containing protein [Candidatus Omnitrophica bacterium]|nr:helix-turn-helix domain-containing protein [Candidatus Omnitrophota bacterium]